jgi:GntR family transcriptional regulator, transcriptional repressor for pyruvate dehydrogenase complex
LQKGVKGGAFISSGNADVLTQSLQDLLFLGRVSVDSLTEARYLFHGLIVEAACRRGTKADFDAIEKNIEVMSGITDLEKRAEMGVEFFHLIAVATKNEILVMLVDSLSEIIRHTVSAGPQVVRPELVVIRKKILAALRSRNEAAAVAAMKKYVLSPRKLPDTKHRVTA